MEHLDLFGLASVIVAFTGLITALVAAYVQIILRGNYVSRRIDDMWSRDIQRGRHLAIRDGHLTKFGSDNPQHEIISGEAKDIYGPIAPTLRELKARNLNLTDGQLGELIWKKHGQWLLDWICSPLGKNDNECLAMAIAVANGPPPPSSDSGKHPILVAK